jgi:glycosyltransferase involved in cell wall biosynthesis
MMKNQELNLDISIVIPTIGRAEILYSTLQDLCQQDIDNWECLIIAQSPMDFEAIQQLATDTGRNIKLLQCSQPNASLARNIGLLESRGKVVLFLDDDLKIDNPSFLKAHLKNYEAPLVSGVFGQVLNPNKEVRTSRHPRSENSRIGWLYFPPNYNQKCSVRNGASCNLSVRREWAISVGGMDAQFEKGAHREESDFCLRFTQQYGELIFAPEASVIHLSVGSGGCRSWGINRGIHPLHHITGEWYFLLKNLQNGHILWHDLPDHLYVLLRRQIWNEEIKWQIPKLKLALQKSLEGYKAAQQKLKQGPLYLNSVDKKIYTSLNFLYL